MSSNWAGWVALRPAGAAKRFSSVSGAWIQPAATCDSGRTYSAAWVGLGGYGASELEQIGTDADCTSTGHASYTSWYELVPAGPVKLGLKVHPGDRLVASVTARGHDVTLKLRDLTSGALSSTTRRVSTLAASSAEWIAEAPSLCVSATNCSALPLTDFGAVDFSSATATAAGRTGAVGDRAWSALAIELRQGASLSGRSLPASARAVSAVTAVPSSPPGPTGAFSVTWQQNALKLERPAPTLPGLTRGAQ